MTLAKLGILDFIADIGPVSTAEELLEKLPKNMADHMRPLLDRQTRLMNGDIVTFRDAIERVLGHRSCASRLH